VVRALAFRELKKTLVVVEGLPKDMEVVVTGGEGKEEYGRRIGSARQSFEQGDGLRVALLKIETGGQSLPSIVIPGVALQSRPKLDFSLR
jgi:hypothetical protein